MLRPLAAGLLTLLVFSVATPLQPAGVAQQAQQPRTWQEDQDKVFKGGLHFLFGDDIKVANLLGRLGAWSAHFFVYNGFGLASFLICSLAFVFGANLLFGRKIFSLKRNLRYVLAGLLFFSVALSFISPATSFPWGGAVGDLINNWLQRFLGWIGTAVLLSVGGLAYCAATPPRRG